MCPDPFHKIVITFSPFSPSFTPQSFANCCSLQLAFKLSFQAVLSQKLQKVHKDNNFTDFPWFQTIFLPYLQIVISDNCFACTCTRHLFAIIQIVVWSTFLQIVVLELIVPNQVLTKCVPDNLFANCCSVNFFLQIVRPGTGSSGSSFNKVTFQTSFLQSLKINFTDKFFGNCGNFFANISF